MIAIEIIVSLLILIGTFFTLLTAIGVIRLRDVYSRMHAGGKTSTLGVVCLMLATMIYFIPEGEFHIKIFLAIIFVFMTAPLSALVVTRSAYRTGIPLEKNSVMDELETAEHMRGVKREKTYEDG